MKSYLSKLIIFLLLTSFLAPLVVSAQDCPPGKICIKNPLKAENFEQLVNQIIKFIFNLALWIAPIMFIIAGFFYITATGDPKKIQTAKDIILYTIIGLIIVISARGLIKLFESIFRK